MSAATKQLILVDGSSYLYRAFHALPALTNSKGQPTGAIYGLINMLKRLLNEHKADYIAVVFDAKGKTFRDDWYAEYKANRKEMPDELVQQIEPIHRIINAMGLPLIMIDGVEADDVIGTLAIHADRDHVATLISTGDKDLAQLVNKHITLINTMNNTLLNMQTVKEKFGVTPEQMIDYLTLVGDTSDNIPGVPQVGPKTAAKWLQEYASLEKLIAHAEKISGKVGEKFRAHLSQIPLTKKLVTIKTDVPLSIHYDDLIVKNPDKKTLIEIYTALEFKSWLSELLEENKNEIAEVKYQHYETITTKASLQKWIQQIKSAPLFAIDTETTSLDYMSAKLVGISLATKPHYGAYIPLAHDYLGAPDQLPMDWVLQELKPILEDPTLLKVGQNIKYDLEIFANVGIHLQGIAYDTMLESYILDSTSTDHGMDSLALKYLGWRTITFADIAGKGSKQLTFNQIDVSKASTYAAEDADVTLQLHQKLWPSLSKERGLAHIFKEIEMPLVPVLAKMERIGVLISPEKLREQGKELEKQLLEIEKEIYHIAGKPFNIQSPKQLQEVLFVTLKLPILQKTPTGQASTADNVLQELAGEYFLAELIIKYRSLSKLISTYTTKLVLQMNTKTGRIHTSYNQASTATGRLSSSEPNLQNIPIRMPEGRRIRQAFIAPPGTKLVSADYSQIELRLMADIANDPALIGAFKQNLDIHKATASEVWNVPIDQVTSELRRNAKAINFGLIYGMSAFGLTKQLGIDRHAAQEYIDRYFARYPQVKNYMDSTREKAKEQGYVETLWGRRLYLPEINSSQIMRRRAAERAAINAPLQGSAADIIKLAMIRIDAWIGEKNIPAKMIMQVHDELVFEVAEHALEPTIASIEEHMTSAVKLKVPLLVSTGTGDNWDEASEH